MRVIGAYEQALTVMTQTAMPVEYQQTMNNLGTLYFDEKHWDEGFKTYNSVIDAGRELFLVASTDAGRQNAIKQSARAYTRSAYCLLQLGRFDAALARLENGKTRLLAESFALDDSNLQMLSEAQRDALTQIRDQIRALEAEYRLPADHRTRRDDLTLTDALRAARDELNQLIETIRADHPDFMPQGLEIDAILALIPENGVLVAPLFTSQGSAVFIVPHGVESVTAEHVVMLDQYTNADVNALLVGSEDNPGWLRSYFAGRGSGKLLDTIDTITQRLWTEFVHIIDSRLSALASKPETLLFMPQGGLGLLPVHVAWREIDGNPRYLMDDYDVVYLSSAYALQTAKQRSRGQTGQSALIAGVSVYPEGMSDLPNTDDEAEAIAKIFDANALIDDTATVGAVKSGADGVNYLHLSCHGAFAWGGDTYQSGLFLHNGEMLTMGAIMGQLNLKQTRLVTLSACETGITDLRDAPDEFLGLPAAFMQAGASSVVSSLWTVEDRSTMLLMEKFYQKHVNDGLSPSQALREAQFWLRNVTASELGTYYQTYLVPRLSQPEAANEFVTLMQRFNPNDTPYARPFYWAAFTYTGVYD